MLKIGAEFGILAMLTGAVTNPKLRRQGISARCSRQEEAMSTIMEVKRTRAEAHGAMLQEALSRPGVREFMEVYRNWQEVDKELEAYRRSSWYGGRIITSDRTSNL